MWTLQGTCWATLSMVLIGEVTSREEVYTTNVRDLFYGCAHSFYTLFYAMEDAGLLDPSNEVHLYALHYVFLPRLNQHIAEFVDAHTRAPISTEHNKSPLQLWISGLLNVWNSTSQIAVEQSMVVSDYFALCLILAGMTP